MRETLTLVCAAVLVAACGGAKVDAKTGAEDGPEEGASLGKVSDAESRCEVGDRREALVDRVVSLNFFGVASWYVGYLLINSYSHANFEIKSENYLKFAGKYLASTTYHSLHHSRYINNYGLGTRFLDRWFGTEWADYENLYARVIVDGVPLKKLSEKVAPLAKV